MAVCPQCGAESRAEARFCDSCGAALAVDAERPREERKVVTVLFADLVGFTSRAEQMDPEDVRAVLEPYHARLRRELEQRGGTVEKFIGDAVMALFGAPTAHEDDPERAVRAGIAIRDWISDEGDLEVRIAVTTGEALVALGARPAEGEGMASGDVVNTAARLQSAAPVDGILVDDTTYRATSQKIDYREVEPVTAKGKQEPVPAWEVLEARSRYGVDLAQAPRAPLIGRERELDALVSALERVRAERSPQLVTLVGVPGIGKSRLVYELSQVIEREPELTHWRQGRSLPYGEGVSFWALGEMVKAHAGIFETDSFEEAACKLRRSVGVLSEADADWVTGHLEPLVGIVAEQDLHGDRSEAFAAWRRFFEGIADERPLVLVFEDLHWADEGLLDFVDHLIDWASGAAILVVCTARPELLSRRAGWGGGKPNALTLSLSPLDDEQTSRLLAALLERSVLPAQTQTALLQRAGGNPLYAEEFVRMVGDRGLEAADEELPLPESIQGIVAARLDGLPESEKALLQAAAVTGKVFWLGATCSIGGVETQAAQDALHRLERKEFVRRKRLSSMAGETEYAFRHLLVRDVAYGQIPRAHRAEKHKLAAEWIEASGRIEDNAELLAYHYSTALELARAVGVDTESLADRARVALREAGDRAHALGAYATATRFYEAAVELWPAEDAERPHLLFRHGFAAYQVAPTASVDILADARDELLRVGDRATAAEAESFIARGLWMQGRRDEYAARLRSARELVADLPSSPSKARVIGDLARHAGLTGDLEEGVRLGREALAMATELGLDDLRAAALNSIGIARGTVGDIGALDDLEASASIAVAANSAESVRAYGNMGSILFDHGELARAFAALEEGSRLAEKFGAADSLGWLQAELVWKPYFEGRWDEAATRLDEFIADFTARRYWLEPGCRWLRGRMRLARDDVAGAREDAERALELGREAEEPQTLRPALAFAARAFYAVDPGRSRSLAEEVLTEWQAHDYSTSASESEWVSDLASILRELGLEDALREAPPEKMETSWRRAALEFVSCDYSAAARIYAEIGDHPSEAFARLRAASALVREGRRAEADIELQPSLAFWRSVGATAYEREGEALMAASA
jgi:class 3 adenylate cyclase/tetratricopeptide (TPR) repeat protein